MNQVYAVSNDNPGQPQNRRNERQQQPQLLPDAAQRAAVDYRKAWMEQYPHALALEAALERAGFWNHYDHFVATGCEPCANALQAAAGTIEIGRVINRKYPHRLARALAALFGALEVDRLRFILGHSIVCHV
jgi:hypothetical protein